MAIDPQQSEAEFDHVAVRYDLELDKALSITGESKEYFAGGRMSWLRQRIDALQFSPGAAMDFGCGTGNSTPYFFDTLGIRTLIGIDPSEQSLGIARTAHASRTAGFCQASGFKERGTIDLAFCNGVFHHIPIADRAEAVRFVFEALRPGGLFAFWENNAWNPGTRYVMRHTSFDQDAIPVFPHTARRLLREGGFEVMGTDYLFFFPASLACLRPMERWLTKLPLGGQYLVLARKPPAIR